MRKNSSLSQISKCSNNSNRKNLSQHNNPQKSSTTMVTLNNSTSNPLMTIHMVKHQLRSNEMRRNTCQFKNHSLQQKTSIKQKILVVIRILWVSALSEPTLWTRHQSTWTTFNQFKPRKRSHLAAAKSTKEVTLLLMTDFVSKPNKPRMNSLMKLTRSTDSQL